MRDLAVAFWRFDEADEHDLLEVERLHGSRGCRKLTFAAIDKDQLRQRFLFFLLTLVAAIDGLVYRCEIVCTLDASNDESSILCTCRFSVFEDDDARDILRAGDVRNIERLD